MTWHNVVTVAACAGQLGFALLAFGRVHRSPLALPLVWLSADFFTWNLAGLLFDLFSHPIFRLIDTSISPLTSAFTLHFVLAFVGERRRLRGLLFAGYGLLGSLSVVTVASALWRSSAAMRDFPGGTVWALWHLVGFLLTITACVGLLERHRRATADAEEQARARLILIAVLSVAPLCATELLASVPLPVPHLGAVGTLAGNAVLVAVAMRLRLFGRPLATTSVILALGAAVVALLGYVEVFRLLSSQRAGLVLATAVVTLVVAGALTSIRRTVRTEREQLQQMATLGRFSAQLAHDLKNPLAALQGAVEYLQVERGTGRHGPEQDEFIQLMLDQVKRLRGTLDRYQRLGRVEALPRPLAVIPLIERVLSLALASFAQPQPANVRVERSLEPSVPLVPLDEDLVLGALENLVRNALEAMPEGGTLTVGARRAASGSQLEVYVEDTGQGMDVRTLERAFDDFFTTKSSGSGLGLAFVRRVAHAHGGEVFVASRLGRGTSVRMLFPVETR